MSSVVFMLGVTTVDADWSCKTLNEVEAVLRIANCFFTRVYLMDVWTTDNGGLVANLAGFQSIRQRPSRPLIIRPPAAVVNAQEALESPSGARNI